LACPHPDEFSNSHTHPLANGSAFQRTSQFQPAVSTAGIPTAGTPTAGTPPTATTPIGAPASSPASLASPPTVRPAAPRDVPAIAALVAEYARRGSLLPRPPELIARCIRDWLVAEVDGGLVGCVSLLRYTSGLVEVRSLAVADEAQGQGIGRRLVEALIEEARFRHVSTLFALTRAVAFFERCGFRLADRAHFPEKVWRDCLLCPVRDRCDETAMVMTL
jgi:amino-acid N-acetyltransferase